MLMTILHPFSTFWLLLATFHSVVNAIPTIEAIGNKFFTSEGRQYFMKGIAYQLIEDDPLVDTQQCQRDAALMKELGANAIRVYHVNATADHTGCMNAFAEVGIYLFVDLDSFKTYISYDNVASWTEDKSSSYRAVMDNFQQFDNTAGFFIGNEVLNGLIDSGAAPFLLSATVDLRAYRDAKGYRKIPIGYSATDSSALRPMLQDYLVCRSNETERLDFYALNAYEWCGQKTYETSGYIQLQASAEDYPVPIFFSEDGCNTVPPRDFADQAAIFSEPMVNTWSGVMIYEWIQEVNRYGLIEYGPPLDPDIQVGSSIIQGFTRQGTPTPIQPDFDNLKTQWATLNPTGVASSAYKAAMTTGTRSCPSFTEGGWTVDPSAALPTLGQSALSGMSSGLPASIPSGRITVKPHSSVSGATEDGLTFGSTSYLPITGTTSASNPSSPSSGSAASSASSQAAAVKAFVNPITPHLDETRLVRTLGALVVLCAAAMIWL